MNLEKSEVWPVDYILELNSTHQLSLPEDLIEQADLKPGTHFEAQLKEGRIVIEQLPFSSREEARMLNQTIEELQNNPKPIRD
jgi:antitoxin component of MazEF toxin-antitoxin module